MSYTDKQIENYIINEIKTSVENDVGKIIPAFFENESGFYAVQRLLFPEIDGLGAYITGEPKSTVKNIKTYLDQAMSQVDPIYKEFSFFIAIVYRHGLLHQHNPKAFKYKNKKIISSFIMSSSIHELKSQRKRHLSINRNNIRLDINLFCKDFIKSIPIAKDLIISRYKNNFTKAFKKQCEPLNKTKALKRYKKISSPKDFYFLKNNEN